MPDPEWPPCAGNILRRAGRACAVARSTKSRLALDLDELASKITPTTRADLHQLAAQSDRRRAHPRRRRSGSPRSSRERDLWLISDEAYEDVVFDGAEHVSPASLPGMYERTIPIYTFSKSYAMTGLRLGYLVTSPMRRCASG